MNEKTDEQRIISIIGRIRRFANELILKELANKGIKGLSPSHGDIIAMLAEGDPVSMKAISDRIDRRKNTVTALVDKLIRLGYVRRQRCETDGRQSLVMLTEKGKQLIPDFREISSILIDRAYRGFSPSEKTMLTDLLSRVLHNLSPDQKRS